MKISIIIPNYNGEQIMRKNLPKVLDAVRNYKKGKIEIIIPDDPSTDKSSEVIKDFFSSIKEKHIIGKTISNRNTNQSGFSKNVNRGVSLATGDVLVLLNTDVSPHKDFLDPLISHFKNPNIFAVGCMDESMEDGKKVLRGRGVGKWIRGFMQHSSGSLDKSDTLWASGGSSACNKKIWDRLGGFDELYNPFYWEDIDLSYRARKAGYDILFEKNSIVIHEHTKGAIKTQNQESKIKKTAYRNQFFFVWLNITDSNLILSHVYWLPYHLFTALLRKDIAFWAGCFGALIQLPRVLRARNKMKKIFIKSDREVLNSIQ